MLELLRIKNLALIEDAELEFSPGLNALTGETGAGKSFIMRAVDFLMGERMDARLVRPGAEKATVEALFVLPEGETVIRRELSAETGRSRVFINDTLSSQPTIRDMKPGLVVHTSQHGQQRLLSPAFQAEVLDGFLPDPSLIAERNDALAVLADVLERQARVRARFQDMDKQRDFLEFQKKEIEKVNPLPDEENELEELKKVLQDRERAGECLQNALNVLHGEIGLLDAMTLLTREMEIIARLFPGFEDDRDAIEELRMLLHDLDSRLRKGPENLSDAEDEPRSLDDIEARLYELARLKRKLRRGLDEIVDLKREIDENLSFLDAAALDLKALKREEDLAAARLKETLKRLNRAREKAAKELSIRIVDELTDLGFSEHVKVYFEFDARELHPGCEDRRGRLMWVPNPGQAPQPLDRIASGGELSRFLLALVTMRGNGETTDSLPSLIFDEVDAGIGGLTLGAVGAKLRALADRQQVLLITHWPQLAGRADRHFLIRKEVVGGETFTRCDRLEGGDIRAELSRMAGGGEQGDALAAKLKP
ncbi:MAG: AAA family ATPase [Pseudodesulfovibrio sp.]